MKHTVIILLAFSLLAACSRGDGFTIKGSLANGAGKTLYIEELSPAEHIFIDSIRLDERGEFSYSCQMPYASFYNLCVSPTDYIMLLPEAGERITVTGDYNQLETTYDVRGSAGSALLWQLQDYSNDGRLRLSDIVRIDNQNRERFGDDTAAYHKAKQETEKLYWQLYREQSDYMCRFIDEHPGSLATLIALYKPLGRDHALIDIAHDPSLLSYYDKVLDGLEATLPDNPHTLHFHNSVAHLHHRLEQYQQQQSLQGVSITMGE